jgi:Ras-related protein Rab-22
MGAEHCPKQVVVEGAELTFQVWDTAGAEHFRALTPIYVRGSSVAILVASTDLPDSFDGIRPWLDIVHTACHPSPPPCLLAVNKIDLELDLGDAKRRASALKEDFMGTFYVSAKTGEQVAELFYQAAKLGASSPLPAQATSQGPEIQKCC